MRPRNALSNDWRWNAVRTKNGDFDGVFFFGVKTTGIFCRPSCSSKPTRQQNVVYFATPAEAENAGFRACLRCRPKEKYTPSPTAELIARAFALIRSPEHEIATVDQLSGELEVSAGHLQKAFRKIGLSPKEVIDMTRMENFKESVRENDVTTSLYESGFGSSRSLYEKAGERMGMTPAAYKKGGKGLTIRYTIADSRLGKLLVAATTRGICAVSFADDEESLVNELRTEYFAAEIENGDDFLKDAVNTILRSLEGEKAILTLPLDLHASAFQMRVWAELRKIPYGETRSYSQVAESIGNPKAVRAVARACATNPVALVNPCHRVIASDGKLSGYRWGIERKAKLLADEKIMADPAE